MIHPWQQDQWQQISRLLKAGRLPHAILLQGNSGLGKSDFAGALAGSVLCQQPDENDQACGTCASCKLITAGTHPDLHALQPSASATSRSKNPVLSLRIDEIRVLCETLNQTSQFSGYRVAILDQADKLTNSAANSLLKTLEEPGQNVLIILVTAHTNRLPVTIRSRCQSLRFTVPDAQQTQQWLKQREPQYSDTQIDQAIRLSSGSPLLAQQQLKETEHQQLLSEAMTATVSGKNSLAYAAKLTSFAKMRTLEGMLSWASDLARLLTCGPDADITNEAHRSSLQAMSNKANEQRVFRFYDQINFNILHSAIAVNEQLLWENLLLSWDNV